MELTFYIRQSESRFFDLLKKFYNSANCPTSNDIRVAGGWVRDGLLQQPSNDLDIALSDCTGLDFATAFQKWLLRYTDVGQIHVTKVKANPDKSKHLETAIMDFPEFGLSVDFVNLRSETYASDTRIPSSEFGSPVEDAYRRDFTMNALFFNVMTQEIEDHTNQGVADLKSMTLRTPLSPIKTFLDDPLRIIRAARFLAKFPELTPCRELKQAASSAEAREALEVKLTRDRVRQELVKIFDYPKPARALTFLVECGLMESLLTLEPAFQNNCRYVEHSLKAPANRSLVDLRRHWPISVQILEAVDQCLRKMTPELLPPSSVYWNKETWNRSDIRGAFKFAALLARHHSLRCPDKNGMRTATEEALINLRCKSIAIEAAKLQNLACEISFLDKNNPDLLTWARTFRLPGAARWWALAALLSAVVEVCSEPDAGVHVAKMMSKFDRIKRIAYDQFQLEDVPEMQPLFNGKELKKIFPWIKGPDIGSLIQEETDWQLKHWKPDINSRLNQAPDLRRHLISWFNADVVQETEVFDNYSYDEFFDSDYAYRSD